jgi:hypothetical protein
MIFNSTKKRGRIIVFPALALLLCTALRPSLAQTTSQEDEERAFYQEKHFIPIKGEQDSDYPKGTYLVTDDVMVKKGRTMTFMPGTTVLFKKDTRILVEGRLICQGNSNGMITFGRLANDKYFIPLDTGVDTRWDGIFVAESGSVEISFSCISGSKYGVEAKENAGTVVLDSVLFRENKFQNLKMGVGTVPVAENQYVFYSSRMNNPQKAPEAKAQDGRTGAVDMQPQKHRINWRLAGRIGLGAAALAGGIVYLAERSAALDNQKKSDNATNQNDAIQFSDKAQSAANAGNAGLVIGLLCAIGFSVTFCF